MTRVVESHALGLDVVNAAGEHLPYPEDHFDLVMSNEVIEHVQDDRLVMQEIVRVLKPGGRLVLFCPNMGYPFETHGVFSRGEYHFGNIPLVNYLPRKMRNKLAPHVRVYSSTDLDKLFRGLPVRMIQQTVIFGGYDNLVIRLGIAWQGHPLADASTGAYSTAMVWIESFLGGGKRVKLPSPYPLP